jgi:hypothetical protein
MEVEYYEPILSVTAFVKGNQRSAGMREDDLDSELDLSIDVFQSISDGMCARIEPVQQNNLNSSKEL